MYFADVQATAYGEVEDEAKTNLRAAISELIAALNSTLEKIEQKQIH